MKNLAYKLVLITLIFSWCLNVSSAQYHLSHLSPLFFEILTESDSPIDDEVPLAIYKKWPHGKHFKYWNALTSIVESTEEATNSTAPGCNTVAESLQKLTDDLIEQGPEFHTFLKSFPDGGGYKAWKVLSDIGTNPSWRVAPDLVTKVSTMLGDATTMSAIKALGDGTPAEEFTKMLKGLQAAPCSACGVGSTSNFRDIISILDDIDHVAKSLPNYSSGLNNLMGQLKRTDADILRLKEGLVFELRQVAIKNNPSAIYGGGIPNAQSASKFDMKAGDELSEFKSTISIKDVLYNSSNSNNKISQLLDYFGGVNKASDFGITFDSKALGGGLDVAKSQMSEVIENLKPSIFNRMSDQLKLDIGITNVNDITQFDADVIEDLIDIIVHVD